VLSQIGLLFFMFLVGLELDAGHVRERARTALITSHASIVVPLLVGASLAFYLYPSLAPVGVDFVGFALFVGAAMSVTAFPVLARILAERGLTRTRLGATAIACAAVDDVSAWCILAGIVVMVRGSRASVPLWLTIAGTLIYVTLMVTLGRKTLTSLTNRYASSETLTPNLISVVLVAVLASSWVTEQLGIHALFGAFLVGSIMPRREVLVYGLRNRLEDVMVVLLLPLFFAFTGLRTSIGGLDGQQLWLCGLVTVAAIAGKLVGTAVAAHISGLDWRESFALGTLMNTRGLMELVILNVGLDVGVISPPLFTMMVVMALVTTAMTTPVLALLQRKSIERRAA
jgi:Kef-type K+ transport system membrane component KefB